MKKLQLVTVNILLLSFCWVNAQSVESNNNNKHKLFIKLYGGISPLLSDNYKINSQVLNQSSYYKHDVGYNAGISLGYYVTDNIAVQTGFENSTNRIFIYLRNPTTGNNSLRSTKLETNTLYINGLYFLNHDKKFSPYFGLGASYIPSANYNFIGEDFEDNGYFGARITAGFDYKFHKKWAINLDINNSFMEDIVIGNAPVIIFDFEYMPLTINLGLVYVLY